MRQEVPTIRQLIEMPKEVVSAKPKARSRPTSLGMELEVSAAVPGIAVFVRLNRLMTESYSIGLRYIETGVPPCVLLRVNGDHGLHRNPDGTLIRGPHVHRPTQAELDTSIHELFEVKAATTLPADCRFLLKGWVIFCTEVRLTRKPGIDRAIQRIHEALSQESLYDDDTD